MNQYHWIRWSYYCLFFFGLSVLFFALANQYLVLFVGFLAAFILNPLIKYFERKGHSRSKATLATLITLVFVLLCALLLFYPIVKEQYEYILIHQDTFTGALDARLLSLKTFLAQYIPASQVQLIDQWTRQQFFKAYGELQTQIPELLTYIAEILGQLLFFPIITFYLIMEGDAFKKAVVERIPNRYFEMSLMVLYQINLRLGGYLRGQFMDCLLIGILAAVGLSLLQIKGALIIGIFAGAANAIPYLGPIVGAIPALFMLLIDPQAAYPWFSIPLLFLFINLLDNFFVYPMTVGKSLNLHPVVVLIAILFGGDIAGIWGMILAVPLFAIVWHSFKEVRGTLKAYKIL